MKKALGIILALLMTLSMFVIGTSAATTAEASAALTAYLAEVKADLDLKSAAELAAAFPGLFDDMEALDAALEAIFDPFTYFVANRADDWNTDVRVADVDVAELADYWYGCLDYDGYFTSGSPFAFSTYEEAINAAVEAAAGNVDALDLAAFLLDTLAYLEAIDTEEWDPDNAEELADAIVATNLVIAALKAAIVAGGATLSDFGYDAITAELEGMITAIEKLIEEEEIAALIRIAEDLLDKYADDEDEDLQELLEKLADELAETTPNYFDGSGSVEDLVAQINDYLADRAAAKEVNDMIAALAALKEAIALLKEVDTDNWLDADEPEEGEEADVNDADALAAIIADLEALLAIFDDEEAEEFPDSVEIMDAVLAANEAAGALISGAAAKLADAIAALEDELAAAKKALKEAQDQKILDDAEIAKLKDDINNPTTGYLKQIADLKDALKKANDTIAELNAIIKAFNDSNWLNNIPSWLSFLKIDTWGRFFQGIVYYLFFGWTWGWGF